MLDVAEAELDRHEDGEDHENGTSESELIDSEEVLHPGSKEIISIVRREIRMHQGPLPAPETLEAYKRIDPRFPDAILTSFQDQTKHRHEMERRLLEGSERRANRGQILGTALLGLGLAGGIWVTLAGQPVPGGILFTAVLAVGALSYVFGDYRPRGGSSS